MSESHDSEILPARAGRLSFMQVGHYGIDLHFEGTTVQIGCDFILSCPEGLPELFRPSRQVGDIEKLRQLIGQTVTVRKSRDTLNITFQFGTVLQTAGTDGFPNARGASLN